MAGYGNGNGWHPNVSRRRGPGSVREYNRQRRGMRNLIVRVVEKSNAIHRWVSEGNHPLDPKTRRDLLKGGELWQLIAATVKPEEDWRN